MIVTRFAPSPTGPLHLGHAFAAITAFEAARKEGGRFLVRIEDIDTARCRPDHEAGILADLAWLGLVWDGPVRRQSEHFAEYRAALGRLEEKGVLYPCFCTRKEIAEEIARAGEAPHLTEGASEPLYPGTCRRFSEEERCARIARGDNYALRLDADAAGKFAGALSFIEEGEGPHGEHGAQAVNPQRLGDVVLARKDTPTSYHLSVVVDDAAEGVTLATRGADLFTATHVQRVLQALLGFAPPHYAHHRLILDENGRKFSKRDHAKTLASFRESGASPDDVRRMIGL
jgi:glutamyl-Q tRNA(Asp) synthetase